MSRLIDADAINYREQYECFTQGEYEMVLVAYKANIDALPTIEQSTWISCEEKLPEKEERVLAWNGKGLVQMCRYQYRYDIKKKRLRETFYTDGNKMPYAAKYWMPLPEPPKGDER